jgi:hypothetical protein
MNATVECNPRFGPIVFDTLEKHLARRKIARANYQRRPLFSTLQTRRNS